MGSKKGKLAKLTTCCHSLAFVVTCWDLLSLIVIRCHSLSLLAVLCHFVIRCHSLSLVVPLVVTRCITHLSFYKRSSIFHDLRTLKIQFLEYKWIYLPTFDLVEKIFSWIFWGRNNSDLIEELATKIMSSNFRKTTFGLTQTRKSCNGRMKYHKI